MYPGEDAPSVLRYICDFNEDAPDESAVWIVLRKAPPLPFFPESVHGVVVAFYAGEMDDGEEVLAPLREFGDPIADAGGLTSTRSSSRRSTPCSPRARATTGSRTTSANPPTRRSIRRSATPKPFRRPCPRSSSGRSAGRWRVSADATAYPHRDAEYAMNVHTRWEDPARTTTDVSPGPGSSSTPWPVRDRGVYVNFISEREGEENYERPAELKATYDPKNLFRMDQNVEPPA